MTGARGQRAQQSLCHTHALVVFFRLNLKSVMGEAAGSDEHTCTASLSCSRAATTTGSGPCDIYGIVGAVCTHTVPLRGCFLDMHGPEQFSYYLIMLKHLITAVSGLQWLQNIVKQ